jgi:hypothetical protein
MPDEDHREKPQDEPTRHRNRVKGRPRGEHAAGLGTQHSGTHYRNVVPLGGSERALPDWLDET